MSVASWCCTCFCVVLCVSFCTVHFVMVPLNLTYLHCLQHSSFEHLFNLYCYFQYFDLQVLSKEEIHSYAASVRHNSELLTSLYALFETHPDPEVGTCILYHYFGCRNYPMFSDAKKLLFR